MCAFAVNRDANTLGDDVQVNVMAYDYSGYGISEGEPSEDACFTDAEAAFAYLVSVKKTPPSNIILWVSPRCLLVRLLREMLAADLLD